jgi:hypothetical protein
MNVNDTNLNLSLNVSDVDNKLTNCMGKVYFFLGAFQTRKEFVEYYFQDDLYSLLQTATK